MAGANSDLRFPKRSGHLSKGHPRPGDAGIKGPRGEKNAQRRAAGVRIVATEMENSPLAQEELSRPRRGKTFDHTDHKGRPAPLSTQMDEVGRALLEELDPEDPHYLRKYKGIIAEHSRVWEPLGATPMVIDFSNVMEPIDPRRIHPSSPRSQHPMRGLYAWAKQNAHKYDPRKGAEGQLYREMWYFEQMEKGILPPDFNPYAPGSVRHDAFENRMIINDDRETTTKLSNRTSKATGEAMPVLDTARQLRARARRKMKSGLRLTDEEFVELCGKPIEAWDLEELAKGRPKDKNGAFSGHSPSQYMARETQERIETLFKQKVRGSMNVATVDALSTLHGVLNNDDYDFKGKPVVAASTKVDVAKFLVEHLLGKPTQRVESDISVKLQGILAGVMVAPEHALPDDPTSPVGPTGRYFAGQRGSRSDYQDTELLALERAGIVDAQIVQDEEEES